MKLRDKVEAKLEKITIPTYLQGPNEELPMFCENRVHQRTSGNPYPNAIVNKVFRDKKIDKEYQAIILENTYLELTILPELGGRIFRALDKTNNYDFFYKQNVIKPALIGMLGLWISGGAEFNWPTHHRPSTFMPVDYDIECSDDGSVTVWLSEHDPIDRMKGMVGICLYPGRALFETKTQIYNRSSLQKSFLWWENIAVPVNRNYQIFFPQDVKHVSFHYKKATGSYPVLDSYYNVHDARGGLDIRFQENTDQATSFFSAPSKYDFFGGYDHSKKAGTMHIADYKISPGKKLFTWGYNQLSDSWENALTDDDGKYAELMAGVYSDNQPDLSWIEPLETKCFSQYWYPFKNIGEPQIANCDVALSYKKNDGEITINIYAVASVAGAKMEIFTKSICVGKLFIRLEAGEAQTMSIPVTEVKKTEKIEIYVVDSKGETILNYKEEDIENAVPEPIIDISSPYELETSQECALAGLHIEQYRDPCIKADVYYKEGLKKDPDNVECNYAMGMYLLDKYKFNEAAQYFSKSIKVLTRWNPNPRNTQSHFGLGLAFKNLGNLKEAYDTLSKASWHYHMESHAYYFLAEIDCINQEYKKAKEHLEKVLDLDRKNLHARDLYSCTLRKMGDKELACKIVKETLSIDKLDYWAINEHRILNALPYNVLFDKMKSDPQQTCLDIAYDYMNAGFYTDAKELLIAIAGYIGGTNQINPMIYYSIGYLAAKENMNEEEMKKYYAEAMLLPGKYCFPSRKEEMLILLDAVNENDEDYMALYYLGNLYYSKEHYEKALLCWEKAMKIEPNNYIIKRNLAVSYYNEDNWDKKPIGLLKEASILKKDDIQLAYELNYLSDKQNIELEVRQELINSQEKIIRQRDDLFLQKVKLENDKGNWEEALKLLEQHVFVPCEGGEHTIIEQYAFAHHAIGRKALQLGDYKKALKHFEFAQKYPENLGGGVWHEVMKAPQMYYEAFCKEKTGKVKESIYLYEAIIDIPFTYFTKMYLPSFEYYKILSYKTLGENKKEISLLNNFIKECEENLNKSSYGYFKATPFFIPYIENPETSRRIHYLYLLALANIAKEDFKEAKLLLKKLLGISRYHQMGNLEYNILFADK